METCNLVAIAGTVEPDTLPELEKVLQRMTRAGRYNIVVDLCAVPPYIAHLLQIAGLAGAEAESGFPIYGTAAQAIQAVCQGPAEPG